MGYAKLKHRVRLLFWSGQSFSAKRLEKEGSFKAAEIRYTAVDQVDTGMLAAWLAEARDVQWDYRKIVARKGRLLRLQQDAASSAARRSTMSPRAFAVAMKSDRTRVRAAAMADAGPLAALAERTFRDTFGSDNSAWDMEQYVRDSFSLDRVRGELADAASTFLLAFVYESDRLVGYAKLRTGAAGPGVTGPDPVELQRIYVERSALGLGVGAVLMRASLDAAAAMGRRTLWLGVWERNARAIAFYERWGFRVAGDQVFRLGSDEQRDLVMARPVPESRRLSRTRS